MRVLTPEDARRKGQRLLARAYEQKEAACMRYGAASHYVDYLTDRITRLADQLRALDSDQPAVVETARYNLTIWGDV